MATQSFKTLDRWAWILSIALPLIVAVLFGLKVDINYPFNVYILPMINAILNGLSTITLIGALVAVKQKNIKLHSSLIYVTMAFSVLFLVGYVLYHISAGHVAYQGEWGALYFPILITHIALAAVQPSFVLFAFVYAYTGRYEKHKKIVKFAYPIWLYVAITGVICYLMIAPFYPA